MSQLGSVSAKDLDTPSVGLNSWEGLWSHPADSANEHPWNSVWLLQPHKDFHVLQPAMLWWELNRAWEGQFCIWLTKLRPCESFRGHQLGRAQHLRGWLFSVQLEQAPEKENWGKPWTLQSLASMLLLTLSVCDVLFSSYKAGNNFASDPLSLVWGKSFHHKFIIIWQRIAENTQVSKKQNFSKHFATYELSPQLHLLCILCLHIWTVRSKITWYSVSPLNRSVQDSSEKQPSNAGLSVAGSSLLQASGVVWWFPADGSLP